MKPSDFPRDVRFQTPGPAFIADGVTHLRSYRDVRRAMLESGGDEFTQDAAYWRSPRQRVHLAWYVIWATGAKRCDGTVGGHPVLRGVVEPWFRACAVKTMAPRVERLARSLVRAIIEKGTGEFDLATDLAYPLALRTVCLLTGLRLEGEQWVLDQLNAVSQARNIAAQQQPKPQEIEEYLWAMIRFRQAYSCDELVDMLIAAWQDRTISGPDLLAHVWGFFQAGTETTGPHIINLIGLLSEFGLLGQARDRLGDNEWLRATGEEALRFATPFPSGPLVAVRDVVLGNGRRLPAMTPVRAWFSAANRDGHVNGPNTGAASPGVFDVARSPNRHLAFGIGMHYCLGAELARLEAIVALRTALRYLPGLELDTSKPFRRYAGVNDGVTAAPFQFDRRKAEQCLRPLQTVELGSSA